MGYTCHTGKDIPAPLLGRSRDSAAAGFGPNRYRAKITVRFARPSFTPGTAKDRGINVSI